jgi:RNA polymerase sigma-70 factor (ECF subfamily)
MSEETGFSPDFVDQLIAGNHAAFAELVDRTSGKIFSLALRILGNEQDAEDVLQETYMKALKALPNFLGKSSVTTWLFRIAVNEALMVLRKQKPSIQLVELDQEDEEKDGPLEIVDWCCLPENELVNEETREQLQRAADKLSPALKMVFLLRDVQGFSGQETAEILGINEDAVKTRLVRARLKLREDLSAYFREQMDAGVTNG